MTRVRGVAKFGLALAALVLAWALGAGLGGWTIAAGWGWTALGWVGSGLALGGLATWVVALRAETHSNG